MEGPVGRDRAIVDSRVRGNDGVNGFPPPAGAGAGCAGMTGSAGMTRDAGFPPARE